MVDRVDSIESQVYFLFLLDAGAPLEKPFVKCVDIPSVIIGFRCSPSTADQSICCQALTMTRVQASSMTSPSASVVPLSSITQNNANTRGLDRISHFKFTFVSPTRACSGVQVIVGLSGKRRKVKKCPH
jgi:hypothetical protein